MPSQRTHGFTLVEVLVVGTILGVVAATAAPYLRSVGAASTLAAFTDGFFTHLHLARSEAIKRRGPVVLCKSADGKACSLAGGWEQGWIVFGDADGDGMRDPEEPVLGRGVPLQPGFLLHGNLNVSRYVQFMPTGATKTSSGAFQAGTLTVCRASPERTEARQIVINAVGRPRQHKLTLERCD
jgi:type IV fimbrial biogenesis protein FimT